MTTYFYNLIWLSDIYNFYSLKNKWWFYNGKRYNYRRKKLFFGWFSQKIYADISSNEFLSSTLDLSLHSSPSRPQSLCLSGFREVKSFLYLFTHSSPLFTHIEFVIHYTQYGKKKEEKAWRFGKIIVNLQLENKD